MAEKNRVAKGEPAQGANGVVRLEECRERLQSMELLSSSSPRDALVLAHALLDDLVSLLAAQPDAERKHLTAAQRWLEEAQPNATAVSEGIAALRQVVADLAPATGRTKATGFAAFRAMFRHATWVHAAIAVGVVVVILVVAMQTRGGQDRRVAEFETSFSDAMARLGAGDHAGAVERFRKGIDAMPGKDRTADAWNNMGWSLQQLGRYEEAIDAYRKALLLRPAFALARNNLDAAQRKLDLKKSEKERLPAATGK